MGLDTTCCRVSLDFIVRANCLGSAAAPKVDACSDLPTALELLAGRRTARTWSATPIKHRVTRLERPGFIDD
jgi:hypothetical protein